MSATGTAVAVAASPPAARPRKAKHPVPGLELPLADALLRFPLRSRQARAAAREPAARLGLARVPGSIREAIVHWLDEQL